MKPLIRIPRDRVESFVGLKVHWSSAVPGCVWVLSQILPGECALLTTPKTGRTMIVRLDEVCYLRCHEP